jgi:hypothetical protein
MAVCRIIEAGITPEQYAQIRSKLGMSDSPPPGATLHLAALDEDDKLRIVEVWDSRDEAEQWGVKVAAARKEFGLEARPPIVYYEVHNFVQA